MTDRYDQDLLLDYLEGDLDPAARAQVDQMLASDPPLAALMRSLAQDREQLRSMPAEDAPGDLSLDLVQGLERRMLLDAPQVEAASPIPISRGRGMAPPTGGVRWGRIVGLTGMAAAIALAAGAVIWFDRFNPLSQTALEMGQPSGPADQAMESDAAGADAAAMDQAGDTHAAGSVASSAPGTLADTPGPAAARSGRNEDPASLADRARQAMLEGAAADRAQLDSSPIVETPRVANDISALEIELPAAALANVTITAFAPDQALRIESDNQQASLAEVLDWCVRNGVPIVEPQVDYEADADTPDDRQIAILIEQTQLDALITNLNRATLEQRTNRQRAVVDTAGPTYYQQARATPPDDGTAPQSLTPPADDAAAENADAPPTIVELRVPEDLGDDVQTRLNVANTLLYSNRAELALAAQRDAEVIRNRRLADEATAGMSSPGGARAATDPAQAGPGQADDAGDTRNHPFSRGGGATRGGGSRAGGDNAQPPARPDATPDDAAVEAAAEDTADADDTNTAPMPEAQEEADPAAGLDNANNFADAADDEATQTDEAETEGTVDAEPAPPARGNWLLPQVPLAPSTPIWTDPPTAQLVPIVFARRMLEDAAPREPGPEPDTVPDDPAESDAASQE